MSTAPASPLFATPGRRRLLLVVATMVVVVLLVGSLYWEFYGSKSSGPGGNSPPSGGLTIAAFTVTPSVVPQFHMVSFQLRIAGGTGVYSFHYQGMPPGCEGTPAYSMGCSPQAAGNFSITAMVNDTGGHTASSVVDLEVTPNHTVWINMTNPARASHYGATWAFNTTLSATASGATNQVKVDLFNWSGPSPAAGTAPVSCAAGGSFSGCLAPASGWYGVLLSASGGVLAIFPNATGGFSPGTVGFSSGQTLAIVAGANLATYDGLTLLATTGNSVRANTIGL